MSTVDDIEAVLFDLDGTVCRRTQDVAALYDRAFERAGVEPFGEPAALWPLLDGPPDPDDQVGHLAAGFTRLAARHGRRVDAVALAEAFIAGVDNAQVEFADGAERALEWADARGPAGLLTNGPSSRQRPKVEALTLDDRLNPIVYAGDLPRRKPHTDPFERALAELGTAAERTLYVGDSLAHDVAGAHNAGLPVAWVDDGDGPGEYRPDLVLESVGDLPDGLG
ncbi:MAG: HAD family hydrolase [Haloarculaceae archaeon]